MPFELLKLVVQAIALERDDDGKIVGERAADPIAVYTLDQLFELRASIEAQLAAQQMQPLERKDNGDASESRDDTQRRLRQPGVSG